MWFLLIKKVPEYNTFGWDSRVLRHRKAQVNRMTSPLTPGEGGVLPYIRYIGMCRPKGYGF